MTNEYSTTGKSPGNQRKPNWELLIFAVPFTCFAVYMTYGFYLSYEEQRDASSNFKPVSAKILQGRVETTMNSNAGGSSTRVHLPRIVYAYNVDGRSYQSRKFSYFGPGYSNSQDALRVVERYPVGSKQTAYYNPDQPSEAVLNKAMPGEWWQHFWFPAIFLGVSFLSLFACWKGWLRKSN